MSSQTLKVDCDARAVLNDAAIAAGMGDKDLALEVCKKLVEVEKSYELRLRTGEQYARKTGAAFIGKPMQARFASTCAVCRQGISQGSDIIYNGELKRAAHAGCAEVG